MPSLPAEARVRIISSGGVFLRTCPHSDAVRGVREGRFTVRAKTHKRLTCVIDKHAHVSGSLPPALNLVYREKLRDTLSVFTLKRPGKFPHQFVGWDPNLTFEDLRLGRLTAQREKNA